MKKKYDTIVLNSLVVCYSSWDKYWPDNIKHKDLREKVIEMHFPVFS